MNENVKQAKEEAKRSHKNLEEALGRLGNEIEDRVARVADVADQTRDFAESMNVDRISEIARAGLDDLVGYSVVRAREGAQELLEDLAKIAETQIKKAEAQIKKIDARPVLTWAALLVGGFAAGFLLAKKTSRGQVTSELDSTRKQDDALFAGDVAP